MVAALRRGNGHSLRQREVLRRRGGYKGRQKGKGEGRSSVVLGELRTWASVGSCDLFIWLMGTWIISILHAINIHKLLVYHTLPSCKGITNQLIDFIVHPSVFLLQMAGGRQISILWWFNFDKHQPTRDTEGMRPGQEGEGEGSGRTAGGQRWGREAWEPWESREERKEGAAVPDWDGWYRVDPMDKLIMATNIQTETSNHWHSLITFEIDYTRVSWMMLKHFCILVQPHFIE